ncbi:Uncharacterised protein [Chlamydia trachomatis]|nr:Uncharacterised protein [Chlamydia trachomatis]
MLVRFFFRFPEVCPVVEVDDGWPALLTGVERHVVGVARRLFREAGCGDPEDSRVSHGVGRNVLKGEFKVRRGWFAVEVERKVVRWEDLAERDRGVERRLCHDIIIVDAQAAHFGAHEAPKWVVANAGDNCRAVAVTCGSYCYVGWATS